MMFVYVVTASASAISAAIRLGSPRSGVRLPVADPAAAVARIDGCGKPNHKKPGGSHGRARAYERRCRCELPGPHPLMGALPHLASRPAGGLRLLAAEV